RRLALLTDEDANGRALATAVAARAPAAGIAVVRQQEVDEHATTDPSSIRQLLAAGPGAVLDTTAARPGAAGLWRRLTAADPRLQLYAPASLADPSFVAALGGAAARSFAHAFAARYGYAPSTQARFGYEAMRGVLAAIRRSEAASRDGRITREAVVRAYFRTDARASALGSYAIDRTGDTTLRGWSAFEVVDGMLRPVPAPRHVA